VIVELTIPKQQLHCWPGAKAFASTTKKSTNQALTTGIHNNKTKTCVIVELTTPKQQLYCWPGAKAFALTIT